MGNYFQIIIDRDASLAEANRLAFKIRDRLIEQGIIKAEMKPCVLSSEGGMGYPPGSKYEQVVDDPSSAVFELAVNGFQIIIGRTVFDNGQGGFELICHQCRNRIDGRNISEAWSNAVTEWYENTGGGILNCPYCGCSEAVTDWHYKPAFGFGNLGFEFWNWSPLTETFIADISRQLGHRTVYVTGKL